MAMEEMVYKLRFDTSEAVNDLNNIGKKVSQSIKPSAVMGEGKGKEASVDPFKQVTAVAKKASSGMSGLIESLAGVGSGIGKLMGVMAAFSAVIAAISAVIAAIVKLFEGTDTFNEIKRSFSTLIHTLKEALAPVIAIIGEAFMVVADSLGPILAPIIELLAGELSGPLTIILEMIKALMPMVAVVGKLVEMFIKFNSIIGGTLLEIMTSLMLTVTQLVSTAIEPLIEWLDKVLDKVGEFFDVLKQKLQDFITDITGGFIQFGKVAQTRTTGRSANFKTSLDTWETSGKDITAGDKKIVESIATNNQKAIAKMEGLFSDTKEFFRPLLAWVRDIAEAILPPIIAVLQGFFKVITSVLNGIGAALQGIANVVGGALDVVASIFNGLVTTINKIKSGINTYVIDPVNTVLSFIKGIKIAGWKPFESIGLLKTFSKGGTVDGLQVWGMSERGNPEFMFNAGGHDTVINADILEAAMYQAVRKANKEAGAIEVSVKQGTPSGPRELAQWLLPSLQFALRK